MLVCFLSSQSINQITYEGLVFLKSTKLNGSSNFSHEKIILGLLHSENGISALMETQSKNRNEMSEVCACVGRVGRGLAAGRMAWLQLSRTAQSSATGDGTNTSEHA